MKNNKTCPVCRMSYEPDYPTKEESPISTMSREQHISGICSDECWDKLFEGSEDE